MRSPALGIDGFQQALGFGEIGSFRRDGEQDFASFRHLPLLD